MSISVIIPAHNAAPFLAATIRSVLAQTLPPDQVLVIDDGSTDDTAAIARSFAPPVHLITQLNAGLMHTRNNGVRAATSDWIAFLDADDLWAPRKLELQMQQLAANPQANVCYTARTHFTEVDGRITPGIFLPVPPPEKLHAALLRNTTFMSSSVVIRRSVYLANGGYDPHAQYMDDWDFWWRLFHAGVRFAACPESLLLYRVHPDSMSHNAVASLRAAEMVYRQHALPHLPRISGALRFNRVRSEHEAHAALRLRSAKAPGHLSMMLRSILRDPFHDAHRFKILAHMIYKRLSHPALPTHNAS